MEFTSGIDEYITKEQPFFMLNNAVIYDKFKKMSREEILCSDILLFQFIRRSLIFWHCFLLKKKLKNKLIFLNLKNMEI